MSVSLLSVNPPVGLLEPFLCVFSKAALCVSACVRLEQNFACVLSAAGSDWSGARGQENNIALNSDPIRSGGPARVSESCTLAWSLRCAQMSDKLQRLRCGGAAIVPSLFFVFA